MTAIATARTTNCTNLRISRVNKKKMAQIPTIPRKSGPNKPCRYVSRPDVLSATGEATASKWDGIVSTPGLSGIRWGNLIQLSSNFSRLGYWLERRPYGLHVPAAALLDYLHLI